MGFTSEQKALLGAKLNPDIVRERSQAGRKLSYLEGWQIIKTANEIFGFDGWSRETVEMKMVNEAPRIIGRDKKKGWGVSYICRVKVAVYGKTLPTIHEQDIGVSGLYMREGYGAGHGIDVDLGLAHESAVKEAETDAMKRAFMTFGNPFGLALYDKEQADVGYEDAPVNDHDDHPERHKHLMELVTAAAQINLEGATSVEELRDRFRKLPAEVREKLAVFALGLKENLMKQESENGR